MKINIFKKKMLVVFFLNMWVSECLHVCINTTYIPCARGGQKKVVC